MTPRRFVGLTLRELCQQARDCDVPFALIAIGLMLLAPETFAAGVGIVCVVVGLGIWIETPRRQVRGQDEEEVHP